MVRDKADRLSVTLSGSDVARWMTLHRKLGFKRINTLAKYLMHRYDLCEAGRCRSADAECFLEEDVVGFASRRSSREGQPSPTVTSASGLHFGNYLDESQCLAVDTRENLPPLLADVTMTSPTYTTQGARQWNILTPSQSPPAMSALSDASSGQHNHDYTQDPQLVRPVPHLGNIQPVGHLSAGSFKDKQVPRAVKMEQESVPNLNNSYFQNNHQMAQSAHLENIRNYGERDVESDAAGMSCSSTGQVPPSTKPYVVSSGNTIQYVVPQSDGGTASLIATTSRGGGLDDVKQRNPGQVERPAPTKWPIYKKYSGRNNVSSTKRKRLRPIRAKAEANPVVLTPTEHKNPSYLKPNTTDNVQGTSNSHYKQEHVCIPVYVDPTVPQGQFVIKFASAQSGSDTTNSAVKERTSGVSWGQATLTSPPIVNQFSNSPDGFAPAKVKRSSIGTVGALSNNSSFSDEQDQENKAPSLTLPVLNKAPCLSVPVLNKVPNLPLPVLNKAPSLTLPIMNNSPGLPLPALKRGMKKIHSVDNVDNNANSASLTNMNLEQTTYSVLDESASTSVLTSKFPTVLKSLTRSDGGMSRLRSRKSSNPRYCPKAQTAVEATAPVVETANYTKRYFLDENVSKNKPEPMASMIEQEVKDTTECMDHADVLAKLRKKLNYGVDNDEEPKLCIVEFDDTSTTEKPESSLELIEVERDTEDGNTSGYEDMDTDQVHVQHDFQDIASDALETNSGYKDSGKIVVADSEKASSSVKNFTPLEVAFQSKIARLLESNQTESKSQTGDSPSQEDKSGIDWDQSAFRTISGKIQCFICYKVCSHRHTFRKHIRKHMARDQREKLKDLPTTTCDYCDVKYFPFEEQLHEICQASVCTVEGCNVLLTTKANYVKHQEKHKAETGDITCNKCGEIVKASAFQYHQTKHQKPVECEICLKVFSSRGALRTHSLIHTDTRNYVCVYCDVSFIQKSSWNYHMIKKHPEDKGWMRDDASYNVLK